MLAQTQEAALVVTHQSRPVHQPRSPEKDPMTIPAAHATPLELDELDALFAEFPPQSRHYTAADALLALSPVTDAGVRSILEASR
jgi:hypothetical protein